MDPSSDESALPDIPVRLGALASRALRSAGWTTLEELARHSEQELLALHGLGPRAIRLLRTALAERGLDFVR